MDTQYESFFLPRTPAPWLLVNGKHRTSVIENRTRSRAMIKFTPYGINNTFIRMTNTI